MQATAAEVFLKRSPETKSRNELIIADLALAAYPGFPAAFSLYFR